MKALKVVPVLLSLIYITVSVTIWPTHIICKNNNLEVNYKSCDPLQDVALSVDSCTYVTNKDVTIRLATVLKYIYYTGPVSLNMDSIPQEKREVRVASWSQLCLHGGNAILEIHCNVGPPLNMLFSQEISLVRWRAAICSRDIRGIYLLTVILFWFCCEVSWAEQN
ncbi:uncharacterized protein LOC131194652 isoform X2 [Ahaetulla prasina]|uniref:uncharacterized protein LOC131194652 isoform X2 n=1 Tax=Ahaetulla prasina TaxID=499056 RepID=UPI00264784E3|nr:uncharacterized protein LOC131194652 isoform X2 [Ahaetulla prasina]